MSTPAPNVSCFFTSSWKRALISCTKFPDCPSGGNGEGGGGEGSGGDGEGGGGGGRGGSLISGGGGGGDNDDGGGGGNREEDDTKGGGPTCDNGGGGSRDGGDHGGGRGRGADHGKGNGGSCFGPSLPIAADADEGECDIRCLDDPLLNTNTQAARSKPMQMITPATFLNAAKISQSLVWCRREERFRSLDPLFLFLLFRDDLLDCPASRSTCCAFRKEASSAPSGERRML